MSVQQRRGKYYPVLYLGIDPITRKPQYKWFEGFASRKEAEREERRLRRQQDQGRQIGFNDHLVGPFLERWLEHARHHVEPLTYQRYKDITDKRLIPAFGHMPLNPKHFNTAVIQLQVDEWIANGDGRRHWAPRTIIHYVRVLHTALEAARDWKLIDPDLANPAARVKLPKPDDRPSTILTLEQSQALFRDAKPDDAYDQASLFNVVTGMRQGEQLGLRWRDVDPNKHEYRVRQTLQILRAHVNPSGKFGPVLKPRAKNRSSMHPRPLSELALAILDAVQAQQAAHRIAAGSAWSERGLVFTDPIGEALSPDTLLRRFRKLLAAAGIEATVDLGEIKLNVRFHDLRHGLATHQIEAGTPVTAVSRTLGHSRTSTTTDIYGHGTDPSLHAAAARFDQLLRPNSADIRQDIRREAQG